MCAPRKATQEALGGKIIVNACALLRASVVVIYLFTAWMRHTLCIYGSINHAAGKTAFRSSI